MRCSEHHCPTSWIAGASPEARDALLERTGPFGGALNLVEAYVPGHYEQAADLGNNLCVPANRISELVTDALDWASEQLAPNAMTAA